MNTNDDIGRRSQPRTWGRHGAAALAGLLFVACYPHLDWGWLAWVALAPYLWALRGASIKSAVGLSITFGFVAFGGLLYWLGLVGGHVLGPGLGVVVWLIAVVAQVLEVVAFGAGAAWLARRASPAAWRWGVPALWTIWEWIRQLGQLGTSWGDLANTQHLCLPVLQLSKLTGPWGVTFLIVLVNAAVAEWIGTGSKQEPPAGRSEFSVAVLAILTVVALAGEYVVHVDRPRPNVTVAALQPDINPNLTWTPAYASNTVQSYVEQGSRAGSAGATLVFWPEDTFPEYLRDDYALSWIVREEAIQFHQTIFVGSPERDPSGGPEANSLIAVNPDGTLGGSYMKRHLVPFGEYVPFRKWLPFLNALHLTLYDRRFGAPVQPLFDTPVGPVGAVICYESSYPELTREQVARGAGLLGIVTDDTWYGRTAAPAQHAEFAALRAAETDRYVVRAAATGISEIVSPTGRVIASAPLFRARLLLARVAIRSTITPYVRFGDWFIAFVLLTATLTLRDMVRTRN
ncbi:MAG: apolipoprotein N-acyltransferase [Capsulimonadaceae bacterium]